MTNFIKITDVILWFSRIFEEIWGRHTIFTTTFGLWNCFSSI